MAGSVKTFRNLQHFAVHYLGSTSHAVVSSAQLQNWVKHTINRTIAVRRMYACVHVQPLRMPPTADNARGQPNTIHNVFFSQ